MNYEIGYEKMELWLSFLAKRNRKDMTIKSYRSVIRSLIGFLNAEGRECDPERIGEEDIYHFIRNYIATENTVHQYITVMGIWLSYWRNPVLSGMGLLWNDSGHPNAKWVEEYELRKMVANCRTPTERLILTLGARCGCRCDEMSRLRDRDFDGASLTVYGKGHGNGKVRIIPLTESIASEIATYIGQKEDMKNGRKDRSDGRLLIKLVGKNYVNVMQTNMIYLTVKDIAARSGVSCTTHSLRRFFATNTAKHTDLKNVQTLMGHSNINTTARYLRRDPNELRKAMEEADMSFYISAER